MSTMEKAASPRRWRASIPPTNEGPGELTGKSSESPSGSGISGHNFRLGGGAPWE